MLFTRGVSPSSISLETLLNLLVAVASRSHPLMVLGSAAKGRRRAATSTGGAPPRGSKAAIVINDRNHLSTWKKEMELPQIVFWRVVYKRLDFWPSSSVFLLGAFLYYSAPIWGVLAVCCAHDGHIADKSQWTNNKSWHMHLLNTIFERKFIDVDAVPASDEACAGVYCLEKWHFGKANPTTHPRKPFQYKYLGISTVHSSESAEYF
jgi:hypothetical protein